MINKYTRVVQKSNPIKSRNGEIYNIGWADGFYYHYTSYIDFQGDLYLFHQEYINGFLKGINDRRTREMNKLLKIDL